MRIVSLLASCTEIVCALGQEHNLVGRSHECDYPVTVERLPTCSEPKIDVSARGGEIDRQVKAVVAESLSVYRVDADKLKALKPDVICTQDQCEVCAVSLKDVQQAVCDWTEMAPKIVSLRPEWLKDVWDNIREVAAALEVPERGEELVAEYLNRIDQIVTKIPHSASQRKVACIEWFDPVMVAGNWVPELVELLGAQNIGAQAGRHSPWIKLEEIAAQDPDIIVTMPCGWGIERSLKEMSDLTAHPLWPQLRAVQSNQVYITDGNQYFNRPGPRLVESLEILAEILYPDVYDFQQKGTAWLPLTRTD